MALGGGTLPSAESDWPIGFSQLADSPDNAIVIYNTTGRTHGRHQTDGQVQISYGFQVMVRGVDETTGYAKANALTVLMDQVTNKVVIVSASSYTIYAISKQSSVISLGKQNPVSERNLFTINAEVTIRQWA